MVIRKTRRKSERTGVDHEGLHWLHAGLHGQAQPQVIIHRRLERLAGLPHGLIEFGLDILFDRNSSSHIMMIAHRHHDVKSVRLAILTPAAPPSPARSAPPAPPPPPPPRPPQPPAC